MKTTISLGGTKCNEILLQKGIPDSRELCAPRESIVRVHGGCWDIASVSVPFAVAHNIYLNTYVHMHATHMRTRLDRMQIIGIHHD